jgi:signal transduction histidine kinase
MKWSAQDKIRVFFWLLPFVPFFLALIAYWTVADATGLARDVMTQTDVLLRLERMLSDLKDVEVAQREYVLTGDERFLRPMQRLREKITTDFHNIVRDFAFTNYERNYLNALEPLLSQKFEEIRTVIELYRSGDEARAKQIVTSEQQAMDDIRKVVNRIMRAETDRLGRRSNDVYKVFVRTIAIFVIILAINILFIWILTRYMKREIAESRLQEQRMRTINQELEQRVAQRTEALQRINEDLQQFAYVASHDLQEPLRMVQSYMQLLERRYRDKLDDDGREFIGYAVQGTTRMSNLIHGLLEYSRAEETGADRPEQDVEQLLHDVLSDLRLTIEQSHAEVKVGPMPKVRFDPLRLRQIFQNLIGNALKYHAEGRTPQVEISARTSPAAVTFAVKDNGIGIAPEHLSQIFGIFKRLHGREVEGTGIGLATVKKIVERHGGRIWVESKLGEGSTFFFTILHEAAHQSPQSTQRASTAGD